MHPLSDVNGSMGTTTVITSQGPYSWISVLDSKLESLKSLFPWLNKPGRSHKQWCPDELGRHPLHHHFPISYQANGKITDKMVFTFWQSDFQQRGWEEMRTDPYPLAKSIFHQWVAQDMESRFPSQDLQYFTNTFFHFELLPKIQAYQSIRREYIR